MHTGLPRQGRPKREGVVRLLAVVLQACLVVGLLALPAPRMASATSIPPNNDFGFATVIGSLPYTQNDINASLATDVYTDPLPSCRWGGPAYTTWYRFVAPATTTLFATLSPVNTVPGNNVTPLVAAYEGTAIGSLTEIGCGMGMDNTTPATTPVPVQAGHTYYFEAGGTNGPGPIVWYSFNLRQHVPANDLFAYSAVVPDLPYSDAGVVSSQATIEGFEGLPNCRYGGAAGSTWYRWTATASTSMKVTVTPTALAGNHLTPLVSIWTGASLATLAQVGGACNQAADFGQPAQVVTAVASGTTYYVQVIGANYSGPVMGYSLAIEDADAPRISGTPSAAFASPAGMKATAAPVKVTWAASVGNQLTPIDHYLWEQRLGLAAWSAPQSTKSTSVTRSLVAGSAYTLRVRAVDSVGRLSAWVAIALRPVAYQESSGKVAWKGTWSRAAGSVYSGGADRYASSKGASATFTFTGLGVALVTRTCPACGSASILVDGKALGTVNLKSATTGYRRIVVQTGWLVSGVHTLRVVVLATAGHPRVDIDAFLILH